MIGIKTYLMKKNSILELYSIYDQIDTSPEYQRHGGLWDTEKRQLFIDSIISGYDIPKLYLHALQKPKKNGKLFAIIDGRQRLETLWLFLNNKLRLGDYNVPLDEKRVNLKNLEYRDLAKDYLSLRSHFDAYPLPIICVETENDEIDLIEEMFSRLNQAISLSSAEQRNAMGGHVVELIRNTASHEFFRKKVSFSNIRYQHLEVAVRLLFLENCILEQKIQDTKKRFLNIFTKTYKTEPPDPSIYNNVKNTLDKMSKIFTVNDRLLQAQGRIPIYYLLIRQAIKQRKISKVSREKIEKFHNKVMENKKIAQDPEKFKFAKQDLTIYDRLTIQGTNDANSIQERFRIIASHLHIDSSEILSLSQTKEGNIIKILKGSSTPHGDKFLDKEVITIKSGSKVKWINDDTAAHTVTSGDLNVDPDNTGTIFNSGLFRRGKSFEVTLRDRGEYPYFDIVHPWIVGKIIVK